MTDHDDILDDIFHGAALAAFVEESRLAGGHPCPDKTRRRAYRLYEEALADKHEQRAAMPVLEMGLTLVVRHLVPS